MNKFLKILLVAAAGIVGLLVLVVLAVALLFDPNDYKDELAERVEAQTGRNFEIAGDLELGLFPWIRIETGPMRLANAEGFGDRPFAAIEAAEASVRLLPLLTGAIEIGVVRLEGLDVNLAVAEDGRTNWSDLTAAEPAPEEDGSGPGEGAGEGPLARLTIGGIRVTGANIEYSDAEAGQTYRLSDVALETGGLESGTPMPVSFGLTLERAEPPLTLTAAGESRVLLDPAAERYAVEGFDGRIEIADETLAPRPIEVVLGLARAGVDLGADTLSVDGLEARMLGVAVEAALEGSAISGEARYQGRVQVPESSLRELVEVLAPDYRPADESVLQRFALEAALDHGARATVLENVDVRLDDTTLTGSVAQRGTTTTFDLDVDAIDVDRYLPPPSEEEAEAADSTAGSVDEVEIPSELIRSLDAEGELRIGELRFGGMLFRELVLGLAAGDGTLRLHPLDAAFYGGQYRGDIRLDAAGEAPRLSLDERVEGIQVGELMRDLMEIDALTGTASGSFDLAATGENLGVMRRTLEGDLAVSLGDAAWQGVDIWYQLRRAWALIKQNQPPAPPEGPPLTEIAQLDATATVSEGIVTSDDLVALLPFLRLTGGGQIDLPEATLDYDLTAQVLSKPELARDPDLAELQGRSVPLSIAGPLTEPEVRPDLEGLLKEEAKGRVEELIERELELDEDEEGTVEGEVKKRLRDLIGRD
jgi:AsmA protein